jgi:hypothetical protein
MWDSNRPHSYSAGLLSIFLLTVLFLAASCSKILERDIIVDNLIYQIDTIAVYESISEKTKLKTPIQFVSTLYANLYYQPIPSQLLTDLSLIRLSNGDKGIVNDLIIASFINNPQVQSSIPSESEMHADGPKFIKETYLRFLLRYPTAYEAYNLEQLIISDELLGPESIYRAFMLSKEYQYY